MVSIMFAWSVARIVHCHKTWKSITTNCGSLFPNFVIDGVLFADQILDGALWCAWEFVHRPAMGFGDVSR